MGIPKRLSLLSKKHLSDWRLPLNRTNVGMQDDFSFHCNLCASCRCMHPVMRSIVLLLSNECDVCRCLPAIPRLKLRRSASQTIQPIIPELEQLMSTVAASATVSQGRLLIVMASNLAKTLGGWAKVNAGDDIEEASRCAVSLPLTPAYIPTEYDCALCAGDANVLPGHHPRNVCEPDRQLNSPANVREHLSSFRRPICSAW